MRNAIIISVSSGIGSALARRWMDAGWNVSGTYRTACDEVSALKEAGANLVPCDLADMDSISEACEALRRSGRDWDALVICPGTMEPIGPFAEVDFDAWEKSLQVNFSSQLRLVHDLLPTRNGVAEHGPSVLFFAGGGSNSAPTNFSAYTLAKIALVKACELLAAEMPDTRFSIVGPGWVDTKIHRETLQAGERAGASLERTEEVMAQRDFTPMESVLDCCDWLIEQPGEAVSGRNFSVAHDGWGSQDFTTALSDDPELFKLRRHGNDMAQLRKSVSADTL